MLDGLIFDTEDCKIVEAPNEKRLGLYTTRRFDRGAFIYPFDYWSKELMPIHVTNHSCDPNAEFDENNMLVAVRDIAENEEITFDYLAHPIPASPWNFKCLCGSSNCKGWINAARTP